MERICLYGGSFDPVHLGHLLVARAALEELPADRVVFIPTATSPFKTDRLPAPGVARLQMLRLALAGKTWAGVDDLELRRGGISYTIDTVNYYKQSHPGASLYWLIGQDNVEQLHEWRNAEQLAQLAEFVVIPRPGAGGVSNAATDSARVTSVGTFSRAGIKFRLRFLRGFPLGVSSSELRGRIRAGQSVEDLIPYGVGEFMRNNRLYL